MDPSIKLILDQGVLLLYTRIYRRLVGKLIYLTIRRPSNTFAVTLVNQFMHFPQTSCWKAVVRILRYLKGSPAKLVIHKPIGNIFIERFSDTDWTGSP